MDMNKCGNDPDPLRRLYEVVHDAGIAYAACITAVMLGHVEEDGTTSQTESRWAVG